MSITMGPEENGPVQTSDRKDDQAEIKKMWDFELSELYKLAVKFYKEKEGTALVLPYEARLRLVALGLQASHGPCRLERLPPLGVLDVIGHDRRQAWSALGELDRTDSMTRYIEMLDAACPIFRPFAEAHQKNMEAQRRKKQEEREADELRQGRLLLEELARRQREHEMRKHAHTKRLIQDALNRRTYAQFRCYADSQYPANPEQQAVLIRQLQEQHYHQYIQQLYHKQQQQQRTTDSSGTPSSGSRVSAVAVAGTAVRVGSATAEEQAAPAPQTETDRKLADDEFDAADPRVEVARMWTRQDLVEFKSAVRAEGGSAVLTVGRGQTLTVRVPTRHTGSCLFWEFASDDHDLGFGLSFVWGNAGERQVSVVVGDPDTSDTEGDGEDPEAMLTSCIVPVYRRDCHREVYAGSHSYPGQGVYLLKFDNSYSVWRPKTLYYRVHYTQ